MDRAKVGDVTQIISYKHNRVRHRTWDGSILLQNGSIIILGNDQIRVTEADGGSWRTREPAICFFSREEWFNVIAMIRGDGIHYYCNIGSPCKWHDGVLSYIDYDLDVKIYPDWTFELLDEDEFLVNQIEMSYPSDVIEKAREASYRVISLMHQRRGPFEPGYVEKWYDRFLSSF